MEEMWSGTPHLIGANAEEFFVEVTPNISVRVLRWVPVDSPAASLDPVVVVPGWGSVFEGWRPLLTEWVSRRPIVYIETREKKSARISKKVRREDFEMRHHGHDVAAVLDKLGIDSMDVDWFSSSLGATLLIDAYQNDVLAGRSSILLAPNPDFEFPLWARILLKMPLPKFIHPALVRFAVWVVEQGRGAADSLSKGPDVSGPREAATEFKGEHPVQPATGPLQCLSTLRSYDSEVRHPAWHGQGSRHRG